ncbi:aminoglycoside 6'-N-acetyltransferase [Thermus tengchongensis]
MRSRVRPLRPEDLPAYLALRLALWPEGGDDLKEVEGLLQDPNQAAFGAEAEGQRVGFVEASLRPYAEGCDTRPRGLPGGRVRGPEMAGAGDRPCPYGSRGSLGPSEGVPGDKYPVVAQATTGYLGQEVHRRLGYQEVERIVCFRKDL